MPKLDYGTKDGYGLSYSRLQTLHSCPRKFQIENIFGLGVRTSNVNFAYGHAVAAGIQELVADPTNLAKAVVATAAAWDIDMDEESSRAKKKSLWYAIRGVTKFYDMVSNPKTSMLRGYEVAMFPDKDGVLKPAIELTFAIECHDGYVYEGHIDLVLYDPVKDMYIILELKTTGFNNLHEAIYKNSDQALSYSLVLDSIAKAAGASSSFNVFYLVYKSGAMEYEPFLFPKNRTQRAKFINSLILDIEVLELYRSTGIYPQRGESCYAFFSPCDYFANCGMSDSTLNRASVIAEGIETDTEEKFATIKEFDFTFHLDTIKQDQMDEINKNMIAAGG